MSANCPYCGAKLNLGLRFCVVCGRHVTSQNMGKFAGLKGGFRPADITRRLDEIISVARFKKSRQSHSLHRAARWTAINTIYLVVVTGLFYSAVVYSLELMFPGKFKETQMPIQAVLGFFTHQKNKLEAVTPKVDPTAKSADEEKNPSSKDAAKSKASTVKAKSVKNKASKRKSNKQKRRKRRKRN